MTSAMDARRRSARRDAIVRSSTKEDKTDQGSWLIGKTSHRLIVLNNDGHDGGKGDR